MTSNVERSAGQIPEAELRLLAGVEPRILRAMAAVGILGTIGLGLWRGWPWAGGFAVGAALSALSFHWMKAAVNAISKTIPQSTVVGVEPPRRRASGAIFRFVLRYALIGIAGYVIFRSSVLSLAAFFAGLFVSVAAVLAEITYQLYLAFHRNE